MGIISRIQAFAAADPTIPVNGKIFRSNTVEFSGKLKYDYATIENLVSDERVYSIIALVSSMVEDAFMGAEIRPKNRFTDDKLEKKEEEAIAAADEFCRTLNIRRKFFEYAWQIITHGDLFEKITLDGSAGIIELDSIPLNSVRVLERLAQAKTAGVQPQIVKEKLIISKKLKNDINPVVYKEGEYFHISFKNHGVWRKDIEGIDTYCIYSIPPIATLQRLVNWKIKTIENDISWKNKLLPRWVHKLKMPSIVPSKYTGTPEEKVSKAKADADKLTDSFKTGFQNLRADDDLIISDAVDSSVLEAKSTNYHQPNETITQINNLLNGPQGLPSGALGGVSGASIGMELSGIFAGLRIKNVVNNIADMITILMQRHVLITNTGVGEDIVNRLFIHSDASLTVEKFEKMKTAISMVSTGMYTKGEIRKSTGHVRLPQLPKDAFPDTDMIGKGKQTLKDLEGDVKKEGTDSNQNNNSPQGERNTSISGR
jgi:hypothetical protein